MSGLQDAAARLPRIAVIIPCFNSEKFLAAAIESVLAQSCDASQLVIVDDGSQDHTRAIANRYAERHSCIRVLSQQNSGVSAARNAGLASLDASSDYVLFLDSDDFLESGALAALVDRLERSPNAVAAYGLPRFVDALGSALTPDESRAHGFDRLGVVGQTVAPWSEELPTTFEVLAVWPCIATPGQVLHRWSSLDGVRFLTGALSEDWDFWLRLSARGNFEFIRSFTMNKRTHANALSASPAMKGAELRMRMRWRDLDEFSIQQRQMLRTAQAYSVRLRLVWARSELEARHWDRAALQLVSFVRAARDYAQVQYFSDPQRG